MKGSLILSVTDQAVISAFNFTLNLYLIKLWSPEDFGFFAIVSAFALLAAMIQNALINTPLAVHLPIASSIDDKELLRRVFSASNFFLTILLLILSVIGLLWWLGASQFALALAAGLFIGSQFLREFCRALLAVEGKLGGLLLVDLAYVLLSALTLAEFHWQGASSQTLSVVLFVLSTWGALSVFVYLLPRQMPSLRSLPSEIRTVFVKQKDEIRWSLLGVITTDIQNRGYLYVAAAVFGPVMVAHLQAGRIFFGPLNLLTSAWARVARPLLASHLGRGEISRFKVLLSQALWSFVAFNLVFLACLWFAWPYLSDFVFGDKYKNLGFLVAAWGGANLVFQIRSCLSIAVQALRRFRDLTLGTIFGALVSAVVVALACMFKQPAWLVGSVIAGECVAIVVVIKVLRRHLPPVNEGIS